MLFRSVVTAENKHFRYTNVKKDQVEAILLKHVSPRSIDKRLKHRINSFADTFISDDLITNPANTPTDQREKFLNKFLNKQKHLATLNSGILAPDSFDEYLLFGGFKAVKQTIFSGNPEKIIDIITESGLRGRGGAGFQTGVKWKISRNSQGSPKYIVCKIGRAHV